jgi:hypothetical protein
MLAPLRVLFSLVPSFPFVSGRESNFYVNRSIVCLQAGFTTSCSLAKLIFVCSV